MTTKAQRDYYNMPPAGKALESRLAILSEAIPRGSVVLDIGCNDGSISHALLDSGVISKTYGFDLEDILERRRPEFVFQATNMKHHDLNSLPDADGVLILNLLHHIVGSSLGRAKEVIDYLIERYTFVIIDMGSFTENGDWHWRRSYDKHWSSDGQMWNYLFDKAQWRFKLLRYPTQGQGHRTLWKLYREPYHLSGLEILEHFKRPPGAWPGAKQLIPAADVGETEVVGSVEFQLSRSTRGDKFWIKRYTSPTREIRTDLEMRLATHAAEEVAVMNSRTPRNLRASVPVARQPGGVLQFLYEPDVFAGSIVHFQDWPEFFSPDECRTASILGTRPLELVQGLPRVMLLHACDYQICAAWDGLTALDFEPNNWMVRLAEVNGLAVQKREARPFGPGGVPADVAKLWEETRREMRDIRRALVKLRRVLPGQAMDEISQS